MEILEIQTKNFGGIIFTPDYMPELFKADGMETPSVAPEASKPPQQPAGATGTETAPSGAAGAIPAPSWVPSQPKQPWEMTSQEYFTHHTYPKAGDAVSGMAVRKDVPNTDSIGATVSDYKVLPGIREVPMHHFDDYSEPFKSSYYSSSDMSHVKNLSQQIKQGKEINPLIVSVDHEGPYILEGGHRHDALRMNRAKSFPALVVHENDAHEYAVQKALEAGHPVPSHVLAEYPHFQKAEDQSQGLQSPSPPQVPPQVHMRHSELTQFKPLGGEPQAEHKESGELLRGEIVGKHELPDKLYHVTTNADAVQADGHVRHIPSGDVGLGKGTSKAHQGVSTTMSRDTAEHLQREMLRYGKIARQEKPFEQHIHDFAREDERVHGLEPGTLSGAAKEAADWHGFEGHGGEITGRRGMDAYNSYLWSREHKAGIENPIFYTSEENAKKIHPHNTGIVTINPQHIHDEAVIRKHPLGSPHLDEVMIHADVPISGIERYMEKSFLHKDQAPPKVDDTHGLPLNENGTVTLYHGTTQDRVPHIQKKGLHSVNEPAVYLTNHPAGGGYGDGTVATVNVHPKHLQLDDEFPSGRKDFRIDLGKKGVKAPATVTAINKHDIGKDPYLEKAGGQLEGMTSVAETEHPEPYEAPKYSKDSISNLSDRGVSVIHPKNIKPGQAGFFSPSGKVFSSPFSSGMIHGQIAAHILGMPEHGEFEKNRAVGVTNTTNHLLNHGWTRFWALGHGQGMGVQSSHPHSEKVAKGVLSKVEHPFSRIYHDLPSGKSWEGDFGHYLKHGARGGRPMFKADDQPEGMQQPKTPEPHDFGQDNKVESHPDYAYHATTNDRAFDISQSGLQTHKPWEHTDQGSWPDGATEKRNYFIGHAPHAQSFIPEGGKGVLLRVPKEAHPMKRESTGDYYSTKTVHPKKIEMLSSDKNWHPVQHFYPKEDLHKDLSPKSLSVLNDKTGIEQVHPANVGPQHVGFVSPKGNVYAKAHPEASHEWVGKHIVQTPEHEKDYKQAEQKYLAEDKERRALPPVGHLQDKGWGRFFSKGNHFLASASTPEALKNIHSVMKQSQHPYEKATVDYYDAKKRGYDTWAGPFHRYVKYGHTQQTPVQKFRGSLEKAQASSGGGDFIHGHHMGDTPTKVPASNVGTGWKGWLKPSGDLHAWHDVPNYEGLHHEKAAEKLMSSQDTHDFLHTPSDKHTNYRDFLNNRGWARMHSAKDDNSLGVEIGVHPNEHKGLRNFLSQTKYPYSALTIDYPAPEKGEGGINYWHGTVDHFLKHGAPAPGVQQSQVQQFRKAQAQMGEVHTWHDGERYQKTPRGWIPVGHGAQPVSHEEWGTHHNPAQESVFEASYGRLSEPERRMVDDGRAIVKTLARAGHKAYIVGGAARDLLLGRKIKDVDIATDASVREVGSLFRNYDIGRSKEFGISVVKGPIHGTDTEVAQFRQEEKYTDGRHPDEVEFVDSFESDAARRDLTINSIGIDGDGRVVDPNNGMLDLREGVIKTVGDPDARFNEDKLRMMRAIRFATTLGFRIDPATEEAIKKNSKSITDVSPERIRDEFGKILENPDREKGIRKMVDLGLMRHIIPEIDALKGVEQPKKHHPEGDVFEHTMLTLKNYNGSLNGAWATLLHDIGKPAKKIGTGENAQFIEHEDLGEEMAGDILSKLKFSNADKREIQYAIRGHMRFHRLPEMRTSKVRRLMADPHFDTLTEVARADAAGRRDDKFQEAVDRIAELQKEPPPPTQSLFSGKDVMDVTGEQQGKRVGEIKREVEDKILSGELKNREEVLHYLRTLEKQQQVEFPFIGQRPREAQIGEIHVWKDGNRYQKTYTGWVPVGQGRGASMSDEQWGAWHNKVAPAPYQMTREEFNQHFTTQGKDLDRTVADMMAGDWEDPDNVDTKLWHATTNLPALQQEGFRAVEHAGLGGSKITETSVTYNEEAAHAIAEQLQEVADIVHGKVTGDEVIYGVYERMSQDLDDYGMHDIEGSDLDPMRYLQDIAYSLLLHKRIDNEELLNKLENNEFTYEGEDVFETEVGQYIETPREQYEFYRDVLRRWSQNMDHYEQSFQETGFRPHNDMIVVAPWEQIKNLDRDKIGVVPVAVRRDAKVDHIPGEEELAIPHKDVVVGDYDYAVKNAKQQGWI